jgi:Outer membrane protein beta-barrel domain
MKKSLLILALTVCSFANAQKGTILVLGNVGYSSQNSNGSGGYPDYKSFNFSPKVGYQYNDKWTVGVESNISNSKQTYTSGEYKSNNFSVGGFLRYSKPLGTLFSVYADLGTGYQNVERTQYNGGLDPFLSTTKGKGIYVGVTPALLLNITKSFGLNFNIGGLGYNTLNNTTNNGADTKNFNFSFGQAFSIGVSKNF